MSKRGPVTDTDDLTPRTEREVRIARKACAEALVNEGRNPHHAERIAAERYPLPMRTQRREVQDEYGYTWRARTPEERSGWYPDTTLEYRDLEGWWWLLTGDNFVTPTERRIAIWADLLANPKEEVPDA